MATINRLSCTFDDPENEAGFRAWSLPQDRARARIAIAAAIPVVLVFIRSDYMLFGTASPFGLLVGARVAFVIYSVAAVLVVARLPTARSLDSLIFLWSTASAIALTFVAFTRPASYTGHLMMEVVAVFFVAAVMPNRLRLQIAAAVLMAGGIIFVAFYHGLTEDPILKQVLWGAYGAAVLFGGIASWDSHISRRRLYASMAEVRQLRRILPMCARCKRVRDDEGAWTRVDEYLAARSDTEITHGYCPECYADVTVDLT